MTPIRPRVSTRGMSTAELLLALAVLAVVAAAAATLLFTGLRAQEYADEQFSLTGEANSILSEMVMGSRYCSRVMAPSQALPSQIQLVISADANADGDYYFGDPLFPRLNEDDSFDMQGDKAAGLFTMDDDADGAVDEGMIIDDDEDGLMDEDRITTIAFVYDGKNTLQRVNPDSSSVVLSTNVGSFNVTYDPEDASHKTRLCISLVMRDDAGEELSFTEYVYPRNIRQEFGRILR